MHLIEAIIYARDMQRLVSFYRDILGLRLIYPRDLPDYGGEHWVTFDTGECTLALHSGGTGKAEVASSKIVFGVEEIEASRRELLARGVRMGAVRSPAPGIRVCDGSDPEGNPFSIESHAPPGDAAVGDADTRDAC